MRGMTAVSFLNQWNEAKMSKWGNERNYCKIRLHLRNDSKMSQKWGIFRRESNLEGLKSRLPIGREPKIEASDWSKSGDFENSSHRPFVRKSLSFHSFWHHLESFLRRNLILLSLDPLWDDCSVTHSTSFLSHSHSANLILHSFSLIQ